MGALAEIALQRRRVLNMKAIMSRIYGAFEVLRTVECRNGLKYRAFMFSNSMFLLQKFGYPGSVCGANAR